MHKFPLPVAHDIRPAKRRWSPIRVAAIVIVGLLLGPVLLEVTSICYAQWSEVMGTNARVTTPVLDSLQDGIESGHRSVSNSISSYFQRLPWSPKVVLFVGVLLVMLGMKILKM